MILVSILNYHNISLALNTMIILKNTLLLRISNTIKDTKESFQKQLHIIQNLAQENITIWYAQT